MFVKHLMMKNKQVKPNEHVEIKILKEIILDTGFKVYVLLILFILFILFILRNIYVCSAISIYKKKSDKKNKYL